VVAAFVADIITPLIAAIFGKPDFGNLSFTINKSTFLYGDFINALITFLSVAAAIFFFVVKPLNVLEARRARGEPTESPTTRPCPECLSEIPIAANRCAFCTSEVPAAA
jgi:large conductance mechanosensitive channel